MNSPLTPNEERFLLIQHKSQKRGVVKPTVVGSKWSHIMAAKVDVELELEVGNYALIVNCIDCSTLQSLIEGQNAHNLLVFIILVCRVV